MRKFMSFILVVGLVLLGMSYLGAGEKVPPEIVAFAEQELVRWGKDSVIVEAVKIQNEKGVSLEEIQAFDAQWIATPGVADFMKPFLENECAQHLLEFQKTNSYFAEIFVTDNQGALVAATNKTSDYWQGDEAKFTECYRDGKGTLYFGEVEFDESAQTYLVQVSVPVVEGEQTIGVIVVGIEVDTFLASE
ncbi:MAG: PDC sensor domain-containing protein [Candidatus Caldatribacteriaceae bacterium]